MPHRLLHLLIMIALVLLAAEVYISMKPAFMLAFVNSVGLALFFECVKPYVARAMLPRALVLAIGMPVLAWSLTNIWLLYCLMLIWVPLVARRTANVAPVYLFSLLLLPGLDSEMAAGSVKLFQFGVHDALALGAATALFVKSSKARPAFSLDFAVLALMLMLIIALSRETSATNIMRVAINVMLDLGLPYYIVSRGIRTIDEFRGAMLWLACGAVTFSSILVFETWKAWPIYHQLYADYSLPTVLAAKARAGLLRATGSFDEPTSAALVLAMCIFALWLSRDYFRSRWHHFLVMAAVLIGLVMPQSRSAWIGLIVAFVVATAFRGRLGLVTLIAAGAGILGKLLLLAAQSSPFLSETLGLTGNSSDTSEYRKMLLERGMEEFWKKPIFGYSVPKLNEALVDLKQGEGIVDFVNTYLWVALISGIIGFVIFVSVFLFFTGKVIQFRRPIQELPGSVTAATFVFGALVMVMEMLIFTSFGGRTAYYVFALFGFVAALVTIKAGEVRQHRPRLVAPKVESGIAAELSR